MTKAERKTTTRARKAAPKKKASAGPRGAPRTPGRGAGETAAKKRTARSGGRRSFPAAVTAAIAAAHDKKAIDVVVLNLRRSSAFTDYFVLCTGQNVRQVTAIADAVQESLRALKLRPAHVEGYDRAEWVLMDYFDFIIHVFTPSTREFYSLDRLWGQAERIEVPAAGDARAS
jgi:ribosome-associated protein